jgi:hypothetical protein
VVSYDVYCVGISITRSSIRHFDISARDDMTTKTYASMMAVVATSSADRSAARLSAALLVLLFIAETSVFYWTFIMHVAPFYPINSDQTSYYLNTYGIIAKGWRGVIDEFVQGAHATGVTFTAQGAILGLLFGANRAVLISINLIYFLILQLVQFKVVVARTRSLELAWLSIALLISCRTVFNAAGGIYDYRIDFSALCLYAIWICTILWSDTFRYTGRSLIVAIVAILLISLRYFTVLYAAAILGALLVLLIWSALKNTSDASDRFLAWTRARNLIASGLVVALIVGPLLFISRHIIFAYYGVGHVLGEEKYIVAHALGLFTILDHVLFYPRSIAVDHLGWLTMALIAFALALAVGGARFQMPRIILAQGLHDYRFDLAAAGAACVFPLIALTTDISKSTVVGGIIVGPIILFVTFLCAVLWQPSTAEAVGATAEVTTKRAESVEMPALLQRIAVLIALAIGVSLFIHRGLTPPDRRPVSDLRRVTEINEAIDQYLLQASLLHPSISFDRVTDYINLGTIILFGYERYHRLIDLSPHFGHSIYGIFATPRDVAMKLVMDSDIIVLTDPVVGRPGYAMDQKITEYWNEMAAWTRANRVLLYSTIIFGIPHHVYVPAASPPKGNSK